jgi:Protein of unknown function (DUF499)
MTATSTRTAAPLKPWIEVVSLHPDVTGENFSEDIFALDLGPLADGNPSVAAVYRDPEHFFRVSYLTNGLRSLLHDALSRLAGGAGNRVLKLVTPFGGGKSHTLASLFHAARNRKALDVVPEAEGLPRPEHVRIAVFDGQFFDPTNGKVVPGENFRAQTIWGWLAWSLGKKEGYELLRKQDETRVAPGGDEILALLKTGPNLILLDEVLTYLIRSGGVKVLDTTLREQTLLFLQSLTVAVSNTSNTALVFSMQSSRPSEALDYNSLFHTVDHLAARKDQLREPVEGNEVLSVIQRRLLAKVPTPDEATPAATAFQEIVTQMKRAYANSKTEQEQAEQEGIALRDRVRAAYPFHPALIDLMRERWAAIPDFQRTRGALRFLASCLRTAKKEDKSRTVLGPGDVPIYDAEVRLAFFKEVGQQADFQAVMEKDLIGANATAKKIDDRRARENPGESGKRYASRLATAILMYSFGGLRREGGGGKDVLPPGIGEPELLSVCVGPDMDSTTAMACLKELREKCLYLHYDGVNYCFKKDPNVTLLVEQEADAVARDERGINSKIRDMLEERIGGAHNSVVWPEKPGEINDREPEFLVAYAPLDFATKPKAEKERIAKELFEKHGDKPRQYRNGLALAVPAADQVEVLRRSVRYIIAMNRVRENATKLNLTDDQKSQLREKEASERNSVESAFLKLYTEVWLPKLNGGLTVETIAVGGRQLTIRLDEQKRALVHKRVMELLRDLQRRVFTSVVPSKIADLFQLGVEKPGIKAGEIVDGFYSFLGFTRLEDVTAIKKAVVKGVADGIFAFYTGASPALGTDGKYQVPINRVRINTAISEDEIDLDSGFLMLPQAIPQPGPTSATGGPATVPGGDGAQLPLGGTVATGGEVGSSSGSTGPTGPGAGPQRVVDLSFAADRNQLYAAWQALANLADMSGKLSVNVHAESAAGFDKGKLQNGVIEPLREADLIE